MDSNSHSKPAARSPVAAALLIRIDSRANATLQDQVYSGVRRAVLDGILSPGTRVPSSRALADDLRVSRTTTVLAYEQLIAEGYLTPRRGAGTFVAQELPDDLPRAPSPLRAVARHPPLSRRGLSLASTPPPWIRLPGSPRAFRVGVPALDLFPVDLWAQVASRRLRRATIAQLDYGDPAGFKPLREAIADHVQRSRGTRCAAGDILIVAGAQRGIEFVCNLLLDAGDDVWLEDPGYAGARTALVGAGAHIHPIPLDRDGLDVDAGVRIAPRARMAYVTPSHQFPTGVPMSISRRLMLLQWAGRARSWIVEDDYDSEFRYGARAIPCLHGLDVQRRVIYVGSFSKSFCPALRLGFIIAPPDLHDRFIAARRASDVHPPSLGQMALADFMAAGHFERHLRRMRRAYAERLEALLAGAKRYCGGMLNVRPVTSGLHTVADVIDVEAEAVCAAAAERGVEVMPLSAYFLSKPTDANGLVLGFASNRPESLMKAMAQLGQACEVARHRQRSRSGLRVRARG
jgi:GntR family transcriptional regulator / MocR family aminotransferase